MKLRDLLSVTALIFAANFKQVIEEESFKNLNKKWLLQSDNEECEKGNELFALPCSYEDLQKDFEKLKKYFDLSIFMKIDNFKILEFYEVVSYGRKLQPCQVSNLLLYISESLKARKDRDLNKFLSSYFLESAEDLSFVLIKEARSSYYKALGYYFKDFLNLLKMIEQ